MLFCVFISTLFDVCSELLWLVDAGGFFLYACQLMLAHSSPIRVTEVLQNSLGLLGGVVVFGISILAYGVARSRQDLKVTKDMVRSVLTIYVRVPRCFFLSIDTFAVFMFDIPFRGYVVMCNGGHLSYSDDVFAPVSQVGNEFWSNVYSAIRSRSTAVKLRVVLGG